MDRISASEALYGFMAWLTTQDIPVVLGARYSMAPAAEAVKKFCDANNLAEPQAGWEKHFVHPSSEDTEENEK